MSRERDGDDERPRLSWSEIDKLRDRPRERREGRPRGAAAEARARAAAGQYLKKLEGRLFAGKPEGDPEGALARAIHDAHGTPHLADACRAYLEVAGVPTDARLLTLFLDAKESRLVVAGLEGLERLRSVGKLSVGAGLRSHLRMLSEEPDDEVAYAAEDLLGKL